MTNPKTKYALDEPGAFKFWALQEKDAMTLLKEIRFRWRGSSARVPGKSGKWVAYPHRTWRIWMGNISESKLERSLKKLVEAGLIERERHRLAGTTVCAFLRPTALALGFVGTAADLTRLQGAQTTGQKLGNDGTVDGTAAGTIGGKVDGAPDGIGDGTDHTSLPSTPTKSSTSTFLQATKGKGKAGKTIQKGKTLKGKGLLDATAAKTPEPQGSSVATENVEMDELVAAHKAKQFDNSLAKFPKKSGPHQKCVRHPSEMYPGWPSWSLQKKIEKHALYELYVANWYNGKSGKSKSADWSDEDAAAWDVTAKALSLSLEDGTDDPPLPKNIFFKKAKY
ncbi:hypothetical protein FJW08_20480 [Mesorhizobium sp. B3-2-1]|uniref:hypothetical protein n=1 Tax=Mesorhizobium sp. B3-2-1 TaxID=2589891 RepID=UPI001125DA5F|nr:hypothetical protein [Mesorhizobium sp. B3-2-1]TPI28455.1 hypothetical protein FJW08_20480 [Mesorhizobium sp. B3-2-1]